LDRLLFYSCSLLVSRTRTCCLVVLVYTNHLLVCVLINCNITLNLQILSGKLVPKEAEHQLQTTLCDDFGVSVDVDIATTMQLSTAASTAGQFGKPERKLSPKLLQHPLIETLSGSGRKTHVRSRSDATGLLSVANSSKYHELSGQLHQHLNQVRNNQQYQG